jgi:hypothetical protein
MEGASIGELAKAVLFYQLENQGEELFAVHTEARLLMVQLN